MRAESTTVICSKYRIKILDHPFVSRIRQPCCQDGAPLFWTPFPDVVVRGWEVMIQTWVSTHFSSSHSDSGSASILRPHLLD